MKNLFCKLGWHKWEKNPSHKDYIKYTFSMGLFSWGSQKGTRICERYCGASQKVKRSGRSGMFGGGASDDWRPVKDYV